MPVYVYVSRFNSLRIERAFEALHRSSAGRRVRPAVVVRTGTPAAAVIAGGISRHGIDCWCPRCEGSR